MILIGNLICAVGALFLTYAHYNVGIKVNLRKGFYISAIGSGIITIGCLILSTAPYAALNLLWMIFSIIGYKEIEIKAIPQVSEKSKQIISTSILTGLLSYGVIQLYLNDNNQAAWMTTGIYLLSYLLFSTKTISRESYLTWCIPAFFISIPHLLDVSNFVVITNELIGVLISIFSIATFIKNKYSTQY